MNVWATEAHQDIFTLGKADGDLSGLAADVHQLGILVGNSLSQEEDGVLVLLVTHPAGREGGAGKHTSQMAAGAPNKPRAITGLSRRWRWIRAWLVFNAHKVPPHLRR